MWLVIYEFLEVNNKKGLGASYLLALVRFLSFAGNAERLGLCDRHVAAKPGSLKSCESREQMFLADLHVT